jgi:hypothetical protein
MEARQRRDGWAQWLRGKEKETEHDETHDTMREEDMAGWHKRMADPGLSFARVVGDMWFVWA